MQRPRAKMWSTRPGSLRGPDLEGWNGDISSRRIMIRRRELAYNFSYLLAYECVSSRTLGALLLEFSQPKSSRFTVVFRLSASFQCLTQD